MAMNASRRLTTRPSCLQAISNPRGVRDRRAGSGPAIVSALALHAPCLGALIGLGYIRPAAAPSHETARARRAAAAGTGAGRGRGDAGRNGLAAPFRTRPGASGSCKSAAGRSATPRCVASYPTARA